MGVENGLQFPSAKGHADLRWSLTRALVYFHPPSWPLMAALSHFFLSHSIIVLSMAEDGPLVVILPF